MSSFRDNLEIDIIEHKQGVAAWCTINTSEKQRTLKAKSEIAGNIQLRDIINKCYAEVIRSDYESQGYDSLRNVTTLIDNWRPFSLIELIERKSLMEPIKVIKGNIDSLSDWEIDLANAFKTIKESRLVLFYHDEGDTIIRVVVDSININLLKEYNRIYMTEKLNNENMKGIDFLTIDKEIFDSEVLPEDTIILSFRE